MVSIEVMNLSESDRTKIVEWANRHSEIGQVYLYGSRARGDNQPDSDNDLAIVMNARPDEEAAGVFIWWHQQYKANPDLGLSHPVHIEWYEREAGLELVGTGVERDGILLFEK